MKIAFVNPAITGGKTWAVEPLPLITLASYLQNKVKDLKVIVIDEQIGDDVELKIWNFKPDIVALSAMTMFAKDVYRIADWVKANTPSLVVIGGAHATVKPKEVMGHCDIVVKGEGELAFLDIVKGNVKKGILDYPIIHNLDSIPIPNRDLIDTEFYIKNISSQGKRIGRVLGSRGCPYKCIFCFNSKRVSLLRFNSIERIIEEMKLLVYRFNANYINFYDENLGFNRLRLVKLCAAIRKEFPDLEWECQMSSNVIDADLLKVMKHSGCRQIGFGFESGSNKILKLMGKGHVTVEKNKLAIQLCKEIGIKVRGCFIVGNYGETEEDLQETVHFIEDNDIDFISIHILTPYPGTLLWDICERENLIPKELNWAKFTTASESIPFANTLIPRERIKKIYRSLWVSKAINNYGYLEIVRSFARNPVAASRFAFSYLKNWNAKSRMLFARNVVSLTAVSQTTATL